jgi:hypothetical protein
MGDPLSTTVGIVSQGVDLLDKAGILDKVKNKLVNNPDVAAAKLTLVLAELAKMYQIVDDTLVQFNSMSFEDPQARRDALELLNKARGGKLENTMMEAQAHCQKIGYIYDRYLQGWFSKVLNDQEQGEISSLFDRLVRADDAWVNMLGSVAHQLQATSDDMISRLENDDVAGAREVRHNVLKSFREVQTRLGKGLVELRKLTLEFSTITRGMDV